MHSLLKTWVYPRHLQLPEFKWHRQLKIRFFLSDGHCCFPWKTGYRSKMVTLQQAGNLAQAQPSKMKKKRRTLSEATQRFAPRKWKWRSSCLTDAALAMCYCVSLRLGEFRSARSSSQWNFENILENRTARRIPRCGTWKSRGSSRGVEQKEQRHHRIHAAT